MASAGWSEWHTESCLHAQVFHKDVADPDHELICEAQFQDVESLIDGEEHELEVQLVQGCVLCQTVSLQMLAVSSRCPRRAVLRLCAGPARQQRSAALDPA